MRMKFGKKTISIIATLAIVAVIALGGFGLNDAGYRTVIQYPTGTLTVKFTPGFYMKWFGKTTVYPDYITYDYKGDSNGDASINTVGIPVRYQDGGLGKTYGIHRFQLPLDELGMLDLHKEFRTADGVGNRYLRSVVEQAHSLTAGLMSSESAYAELRGTYIDWVTDQIANGKYQTQLETKEVTDISGKTELRKVPVIVYGKDGLAKRGEKKENSLRGNGITVSTAQIVDWDFEEKTLLQISKKREATMAIITAKANAERAIQDEITAEAQGKADVKVAQYKKEVIKVQAVVDAQRAKEVAIINAEKLVDVAAQKKLEALQLKLAALEYEQKRKAEGRGDASYKKQVYEADGALKERLTAAVQMNKDAWENASKVSTWTPHTVFGSGGAGTGNTSSLEGMMQIITVNQLKQLGLGDDLSAKQDK